MVEWYHWLGFVAFLLAMLGVDLFLAHPKPGKVSRRDALRWSGIWIGLALLFGGLVAGWQGGERAEEYYAVYLIEKSLSVDNLFVFAVIFRYFKVPDKFQHRVLFYGILGSLALRGAFIAAGALLLKKFAWVAFVFGAFLLFSAYKLARHSLGGMDPGRNPVLNVFRKFLPMTEDYDGQHLLTRKQGRLMATPLLAVLAVVETTDLLFAVDSIPASFGVSRDAYIIFTANALALVGLRSLFFLVDDLIDRFRYLDDALAVVLALVGLKMIYEGLVRLQQEGAIAWLPQAMVYEIPTWLSLSVVAAAVVGGIALSIRADRRHGRPEDRAA